ncbi:MAG: CAP domain-containing protein [Hyphomonadaceae bacterium]|nr:CAP domain-containing protein [Hyphomonadaceae bacterium]
MLRFFTLLGLAFAVAGPGFACDMRLDARAETLPTFYSNGRACLETPPGQLRFVPFMERLFIQRINQERRERGLNALKLRQEMRPAARFHSLDMASNGFFAHKGPDGRDAGKRIAAFDRTLLAQSTAENIAQFGPAVCTDQFDNTVSCFKVPGFELPSENKVVDDLHDKLMQSEGHRANILNEESTHVALGVARSDTGFYVTQLFANELGELSAPLPLSLTAKTRLNVKAKVQGWDSTSFAVTGADGARVDLQRDRLGRLSAGDKSLIVRGENIFTETRKNRTYTTTQWLDMFGPDFTVLPATES